MKKNKFALAFITVASVFTLAACSSDNPDIVTMKGGKITVHDFYDEVKTDPNVQSNLRNMIVFKVAEQNYGDKVSKEKVDKEYKKMKDQFGDDFELQLKQNGMTEASYKDQMKKSLAFQEMIKSHVKITDKDLKRVWASYQPKVTVQLISTDKEDKAKEALDKIKSGENFAKLAKTVSTDASSKDGGKLSFDSTNYTLPDEVKQAAYKLKDGEVSEVISVDNQQTGEKVNYVVKMVKNQAKGNDMKPFKKELTKIAKDEKMNDQQFTMDVISKELKKADVKIEDDAMKSVLAGFIQEDTTSSKKKDSKSSTTKDTDKTKDSKKDTKK
ncbi:peptidylprolyl isomerase [Vagococcus humatus]|uniref:Foldase protein PrsA n=1 Tax=Vagococcus humatus TaxID=1889241 RepID=A0A3R9YED5_9ENTE|nr:peptidylprolyl isomerase [Vagococcus humatus]RST90344.1 peptidylprolyl isomerase [Vagococcus humatus]